MSAKAKHIKQLKCWLYPLYKEMIHLENNNNSNNSGSEKPDPSPKPSTTPTTPGPTDPPPFYARIHPQNMLV
jgi:hypothetical protein